jgi:hypothetical protein
MTDFDNKLRLHALADPRLLADQAVTIERLVLQALKLSPSPRRRVYVSPSSGWFDYTAFDELWDRRASPALPSATEALKAAERALSALEQACSDANPAWPQSLRGLALLPSVALLRRIGVHAVPRPDGSAWDHWTYRAQPRLMLDGGSKTRADVIGTQVEVHVGHMGQVIGIRARWSPLSGEQQFTELSPLPTAAGSPGASSAGGTTEPEVKYMHDGDGIPQYYLAPYYFRTSGDGDVDVVSASPYSLTVRVDLTRQGPWGMRLTALASGGSGRYAYNWGIYTMAGVEAGVRTIGPGSAVTVGNGDGRATASAITLPFGAFIVLLNVRDEATGAFKHHQQQVFPWPFVEGDVETSAPEVA